MDIFDYSSYKTYVVERVQAMPRRGYGQFMKIAKHVGVNPVVVTQVLKGNREFTEEQGLRLTNYLGLRPLETEYFMRMIAFEKAGTHDLKQYHRSALQAMKDEARKVKNRLAEHGVLNDSTKSVFYSDWTYGAVRLATSIPEYRTVDNIAERLELGRSRISEILEFLIEAGLCTQDENGNFRPGTLSTHLDAQSRFINNHRRNWRLKGLESFNNMTPEELFFSGPCTMTEENFRIFRQELLAIITSLSKRVSGKTPEVIACLNIDWFQL